MVTAFTAELPKALAKALAEQPHKMYLYLEYTNSSGSVPTGYTAAANIPNFADPKTYYNGLSGKNYLRVPAVRDPNVSNSVVSSNYSTATTFFGQSTSTSAGVNAGTAFGTNSICYGAALVLVPDEGDRTQDLIMGRTYFTDAGERITKTASSEIFVTFPFTVTATAP